MQIKDYDEYIELRPNLLKKYPEIVKIERKQNIINTLIYIFIITLPLTSGFLNYTLLSIEFQSQTSLSDIMKAYAPLTILSTILGASCYLALHEKIIEKINLFIKQKEANTNEVSFGKIQKNLNDIKN